MTRATHPEPTTSIGTNVASQRLPGSTGGSNIPRPLSDYNAFATHTALREGVLREGAGWAQDRLDTLGATVGSAAVQALAQRANERGPRLVQFTATGDRTDDVEFDPAWPEWLGIAVGSGAHSLSWTSSTPGAEVARAALFFLLNEVEQGQACTMGMTHASIAAIRLSPVLAAEWEPRIVSTQFDPRSLPAASKTNAMIGMAMTEASGGSDLRALATRAVPVAGEPGAYELFGSKWFFSVPTSDAFLVLALTPEGVSCFLVPRWRPDGSRNAMVLHRLKDKLGDRSNASAEAELVGAWGTLLGTPGGGIATILRMVQYTRLNTALSSAGIVHQALSQAIHYTSHRTAFGKAISDHAAMQNVLADLALESEGQIAMMLRVARGFDDERADPRAAKFTRLAVAVQKYWTCKRTPWAVYEAMECLGGNGYIEDWPLARLYRQAPLNSIWEGSGNVICLDVVRILRRDRAAFDAMLEEIGLGHSDQHPALAANTRQLAVLAADPDGYETVAREITERLALGLQASLLVRHAPAAVADAFCASRLGSGWRGTFGTLPAGVDFRAIVDRAAPAV